MNRWIVLSLSIIVLGSGLLVYSWRRSSPPMDREIESEQATAKEVARDVRSLKRELARIKATPAKVVLVEPNGVDSNAGEEAQPGTAFSAEVALPAGEAAAGVVEQLTPEEQSQRIATELDVRLAGEGRDAEWSSATRQKILDVMAASLPAASVVEAECAESMCRVVLGHQQVAEQAEVALAIQATPPFSSGVFYHYEKNAEQPRTTLYVLREGSTFRTEDEAQAL